MADGDLWTWQQEWERTIGATLEPRVPSFRGTIAGQAEAAPFSVLAPDRFDGGRAAMPQVNLGYANAKRRP